MPAEEARRDVNQILTVAREQAGGAWVYTNLTLPLMANASTTDLPPEHAETRESDGVDVAMASLLRASYDRHRNAGCAPGDAFRAAAREVVGHEPPPETAEIREALSELESRPSLSARATHGPLRTRRRRARNRPHPV